MATLTDQDFDVLKKYIHDCDLIIETGGGDSTKFIANGIQNGALFISIDLAKIRVGGSVCMRGWSVAFEDFVFPGDDKFVQSKRAARGQSILFNKFPDAEVIHKGKKHMKGKTNLLRKAIKKYGRPDLFFCDTGEYSGYAEWTIMRDLLKVGGIYILHDIYYPKSIKNFLVLDDMKNSSHWNIIEQTNSPQGISVTRKVSDEH